MALEPNVGGNWDRVAAELRACREAQQRAWGDIDNTTLSRYLADEVSPEERKQIESALEELPELRKLTELVRDVLGEVEVGAAGPRSIPEPVPYGPTTLPFPQSQPYHKVERRTVPTSWARMPELGRRWVQRVSAASFRRHAGLVAAACLLLALGVALPRSGSVLPQADEPLPLSRGVAFRGDPASLLGLGDGKDVEAEPRNFMRSDVSLDDNQLAVIDAKVQDLEEKGRKNEAEALARRYASNMTLKAKLYQEQGDYASAELVCNQALTLCAKALGPQAPETVRTSNSLAGVYEVALNTPVPPALMAGADLSANSSNSHGTGTAPHRAAGFLRSQSSYEPAMAPKAVKAPAASARRPAIHKKQEAAHTYPSAVIALRNRITSQSQSELRASVVPVLTQALRETSGAAERQRYVRALGQLGPAARDCVPALLDCYRKAKEDTERSTVLFVLGQIGPAARRSCQELAKQNAGDPLVRGVMMHINGVEGRIGIDDECACFSFRTLQQTQNQIRHLVAAYHLEVLVETTPGKIVAVTDKPEDHKRELGEYGVYLRIDKNASKMQVHISDALQKQGLTDVRLQQVVEPHLRNKQYDRGLHEGVQFLVQFEKEHHAKKMP